MSDGSTCEAKNRSRKDHWVSLYTRTRGVGVENTQVRSQPRENGFSFGVFSGTQIGSSGCVVNTPRLFALTEAVLLSSPSPSGSRNWRVAAPNDFTSSGVSFTNVKVCPSRVHFLKASYILCGPALAFSEEDGEHHKQRNSTLLRKMCFVCIRGSSPTK